jgi:hypothetical protein
VLVEQEDGYFLANANRLALKELQEGFRGVAEELGLKTEEDVIEWFHRARNET